MLIAEKLRFFSFSIFICAGALSSYAEEKKEDSNPAPGHSHSGESFNEGPRQSAVKVDGTGDVHFPITTKWSRGQQMFDQGIGQLHGFWFYEAERTFRQIAAEDPDCAMAYWGMAMANWENSKRAKGFIAKASERKDKASERERLYINAQEAYLADEPKDIKKRRQKLIEDIENIIHENAHAIEEAHGLLIYGDGRIQREFVGKRNRLFHIIKSQGYDVSDLNYSESEYQQEIDDFLYQELGYDNLNYLINGLFLNPYAVTSISEYFASGLEKYLIDATKREQLRKLSPELTKKIEELINGYQN